MFEYIISQINNFLKAAHDNYGVNPIVFAVLYFGCAPIFYYSLFQTLRAVIKRLHNKIMFWSALFLCATITPYLYVLLFGKNIPWWVYGVIALLIGLAVLSLILKLRRKVVHQ